MRSFLIALYSILGLSAAYGHNNLFFPGDAFFSSTWTDSGMKISEDGEMLLNYNRLSNEFMSCGYAGCISLKITDISPELRKTLNHANELLFTKYRAFSDYSIAKGSDPYTEDVNQHFTVLVYNKDFDFTKTEIGLRFNEDWIKLQTVEAGREHAIYDGFKNSELIISDWTNGGNIPALKLAAQPKSLQARMGVEEPVEAKADDLCFVIVLTPSVQNLAEGIEGLSFLVVGDEITEYVYTNRGVVKR